MAEVNILLVDDEVSFVAAMTRRLEKRGIGVFQAFDGRQAMMKLKDHEEIQVVILDVRMPGKNGIEVLREIKDRHPLVEVIMLTAHGTIESAIDGMKKGAFDYLMKPCDMEVLMEKVEAAVSDRRRHEEKIMEAHLKEIVRRRA